MSSTKLIRKQSASKDASPFKSGKLELFDKKKKHTVVKLTPKQCKARAHAKLSKAMRKRQRNLK